MFLSDIKGEECKFWSISVTK